jgi:hypothetical protein
MFSTATTVYSSTGTFATTGLTGTITLSRSTNRVLAIVSQNGLSKEQTDAFGRIRLVREFSGGGLTQLAVMEEQYARSAGTTNLLVVGGTSITWLDSPSTTNTLTYRTEIARTSTTGFVSVQFAGATSTLTLLEVRA